MVPSAPKTQTRVPTSTATPSPRRPAMAGPGPGSSDRSRVRKPWPPPTTSLWKSTRSQRTLPSGHVPVTFVCVSSRRPRASLRVIPAPGGNAPRAKGTPTRMGQSTRVSPAASSTPMGTRPPPGSSTWRRAVTKGRSLSAKDPAERRASAARPRAPAGEDAFLRVGVEGFPPLPDRRRDGRCSGRPPALRGRGPPGGRGCGSPWGSGRTSRPPGARSGRARPSPSAGSGPACGRSSCRRGARSGACAAGSTGSRGPP